MKQTRLQPSEVSKLSDEEKSKYYAIESLESTIEDILRQVQTRLSYNAERIRYTLEHIKDPDVKTTLSDFSNDISHELIWMVPTMGLDSLIRDSLELKVMRRK